jgi:glucose-6-phosphate 1-dehydrogenase
MTAQRPSDQDILIIGASGDLARRKLLPSLYDLCAQGLLPTRGSIVGTARTPWTEETFRCEARAAVAAHSRTGIDEDTWRRFAARLRYVTAGDGELTALRGLLTLPRRLAYLAVPSSAVPGLVEGLRQNDLVEGTSLVVEKPFGRDRASARLLDEALHRAVPEERIFRIDHYLGKETVQDLFVFRFGNAIFERLWNRDCVDCVQITVAESLGVEQRGAFYEETGAIRDIVQNHLLQLLALVAMEPPISFEPEAVRHEKVKVLRAVHPVDPAQVVRGQYTARCIDGQQVPGYREEPGVSPESTTETYAALRCEVDTWRWSGVPFLLRTGKRLARRDTRVVLIFREAPLRLFEGAGGERPEPNRLTLRIQPNDGISVDFLVKHPGPELIAHPVRMDFGFASSFPAAPAEAYERLLHDALMGDHTLFIRSDEVDASWAVVDPVLASPPPVTFYEAGSWGPAEADRLVAPWRWDPGDVDRDRVARAHLRVA